MPEDAAFNTEASNVVALKDGGQAPDPVRLPQFITESMEVIVAEWESFAQSLTPFSHAMTPQALRDHIHQMLEFIVTDMEKAQTPGERRVKSHGLKDETNTAAQTHAALRLAGGFDIGQMASEYRALRASVLRLWTRTGPAFDAQDIDDMTRFNESIDQELAESVNFYTKKVAQSKNLFVGILGHDLRGPVQAIMLSAELSLHMGKLSERQTMLTKNMLEGARRMGELISTLLDVTRARFGAGLPVVRSMMNLGFVAQQIVDETRVVHPSRTIELSLSGDLLGEWDKARVGQVFSNLLGNAAQYGFTGSPIRVDVEGDADAVTVTVGNDGLPISPDKMDMIFDPLTRGLTNESKLSTSANLGLGLYITKEVVVAHGGTIEVTSSEMQGTIFIARFPRLKLPPSTQTWQRQA